MGAGASRDWTPSAAHAADGVLMDVELMPLILHFLYRTHGLRALRSTSRVCQSWREAQQRVNVPVNDPWRWGAGGKLGTSICASENHLYGFPCSWPQPSGNWLVFGRPRPIIASDGSRTWPSQPLDKLGIYTLHTADRMHKACLDESQTAALGTWAVGPTAEDHQVTGVAVVGDRVYVALCIEDWACAISGFFVSSGEKFYNSSGMPSIIHPYLRRPGAINLPCVAATERFVAASAAGIRLVKLFCPETLEEMNAGGPGVHRGGVRCLASTESVLVSGSDDNTAHIMGLDDDGKLHTRHLLRIPGLPSRSGQGVTAVCVHHDTVATGSTDYLVRLWSAISGECIRTFSGHTDFVSFVSLRDGLLVSAAQYEDGGNRAPGAAKLAPLRIWSVEDGECITTLEGQRHDKYRGLGTWGATVSGLSILSDGMRVAIACHDPVGQPPYSGLKHQRGAHMELRTLQVWEPRG